MPAYDNSFLLSRNDRKEKENHPDFRGVATVEGREYDLVAWINEKDGRKFFRGKVTPKGQRQDRATAGDPDMPF